MPPTQFRVVSCTGKVSKDEWIFVRPSDNKSKIVVESVVTGNRMTIHKNRVIEANSLGKAVAMRKGTLLKAVCPDCFKVLTVEGGRITCEQHGEFETVSPGAKYQSVDTGKRPEPSQSDRSESMATKVAAEPAEVVGTQVDLTEVAGFGLELWTKPQLNFDHAKMDVQAHVLLADGPLRKLCFNTYDGTLGKKKKIEDLRLEEFKAGKQAKGKKLWHALKGTLEEARKHLEKKGYRPNGSEKS